MNLTEQIKCAVGELQTALLEQHPKMPTLLHEIWKTLKENPEQVTILEEPEIAIIVSGLKKQTSTEIAMAAIKSKSKGVKNLGLADL